MSKQKISNMPEETWDIKKIAIGVVVFLFIAGGALAAKNFILPKLFPTQNISGDNSTFQNTSKTSSATKFYLPSVQDAQKAINSIQQQIEHINIAEMASSSVQVQQIIKEIQALPQVPGNTAKDACLQLCGKL